jgi:hypothetical protein
MTLCRNKCQNDNPVFTVWISCTIFRIFRNPREKTHTENVWNSHVINKKKLLYEFFEKYFYTLESRTEIALVEKSK